MPICIYVCLFSLSPGGHLHWGKSLLVCSLLSPRAQVRAWYTLVASKHLLKECANRDQPSLLYHRDILQRIIPYQIASPLQVFGADITIH